MPEEPEVIVPAVPVVIVSATVIPSVAVVVLIVGVLPVALLSSCPPCPCPDRHRGCLACCCRCRRHVCSSPPCPPSPSLVPVACCHRSLLSSLLTSPLVAVVSAVAVLLATAIALSLHQRSFAWRDACEVKTQQLNKNENTSVVTSKMNEQ